MTSAFSEIRLSDDLVHFFLRQGVSLRELRQQLRGIHYFYHDTRELDEDCFPPSKCAFIATKGQDVDGHAFISQVAEKVRLVIAQRTYVPPKALRSRCLLVRDTKAFVERFGAICYRDPTKHCRLIGVTGTNGKTSVTALLERFLSIRGHRVGVIGTLNIRYGGKVFTSINTTPSNLTLQRTIHRMLRAGVDTVLMEVSSHALRLGRLNDLHFDLAAFTNLSHEHLDFHKTLMAYLQAKMSFFERLSQSAKPFKKSIVCMDSFLNATIARASFQNILSSTLATMPDPVIAFWKESFPYPDFLKVREPLHTYTYRYAPITGRLMSRYALRDLKNKSVSLRLTTRLLGEMNAQNITTSLLALEALRRGDGTSSFIPYLLGDKKELHQVVMKGTLSGRMEAVHYGGLGHVFVDYAHTPEALEAALKALREHLREGGRLICILGCGGNRDAHKRRPMGRVAAHYAHAMYITNDNPRHEDPHAIASEIMQGIPKVKRGTVQVIFDREKAILRAISDLHTHDILLIAGKGHEAFQVIGDKQIPMRDADIVCSALPWNVAGIKRLSRARTFMEGASSSLVSHINTDSRTAASHELFLTLDGMRHRGIAFSEAAYAKGVRLFLIQNKQWKHFPKSLQTKPITVLGVPNPLRTYQALARDYLSKKYSHMVKVAITGSAGKTMTKDLLAHCLRTTLSVYASHHNENNQIGVPKNIFAMQGKPYDVGIFEMGMNRRGEIKNLSQIVQPDISLITNVLPAHRGYFKSLEDIACAKLEIVHAQKKTGVVFMPSSLRRYLKPHTSKQASPMAAITFRYLSSATSKETSDSPSLRLMPSLAAFKRGKSLIMDSTSQAVWEVPFMNRVLLDNVHMALEVAHFLGVQRDESLRALSGFSPTPRRFELRYQRGPYVIDDAYNANPTSMVQSLEEVFFVTEGRLLRYHFVLGDIFELGETSEDSHRHLAEEIRRLHRLYGLSSERVRYYFVGEKMKLCYDELLKKKALDMRTMYYEKAPHATTKHVLNDLRKDSVLLYKASNGMHFDRLIEELLCSIM